MKPILLALVLLLSCASQAFAHDIIFTWSHATTREDGKPITGERSYILKLMRGGEEVGRIGVVGTDYTFTGLDSGDYQGVIATIEGGMVGRDSAPVDVSIPFPPSAPSDLRHSITVTVNVTIQ